MMRPKPLFKTARPMTALAVVGTLLACCTVAAAADYDELLQLYAEFRRVAIPDLTAGVADYSAPAMAVQQARVEALLAELQRIDDSPWPVPQRVDYTLVLAEMRGLLFQHRVVRPWAKDPAFYSTTNLGFGPKMRGAMAIPQLPLEADQATAVRAQLQAVPTILDNARRNLVEPRGDLVHLAIVQKQIEQNVYGQLAEQLLDSAPGLAAAAQQAAVASGEFIAWLETIEQTVPAHGGIGRDNYNWYLRHVLLFPYSWEELRVLGEREYQRSMVFLKLEEHRHRDVPMIEPAETMAEFERRRAAADAELLAYLSAEEILTIPDWLVPPVAEGPYILPADRDPRKAGPFEAPIQRHFFRETEDRDPRPLRAHNVPGHLFDQLSIERDNRPVRGDRRLYFISGTRAEGWAFYLEEMIQQSGFLDELPKTREINYILQAKRAARVLPELMLHDNAWTYTQALDSLTSRTPYWMGPNDAIARFDLELYLRQPGYGIGYYMGKVQLEALFAEVAAADGRDFNLREFHDRFLSYGVIPISLIRWEMTGADEEIMSMRNAPQLPAAAKSPAD